MTSKSEIWKAHPYIGIIEVSTLGRVRTVDRVVPNGNGTRLVKGHVLKQFDTGNGYLQVSIQTNGKDTRKLVHRLVAQTYIPNPDNLPQVNHLDCNRKNNNVENLEFCTASYNQQYREKFGISNTELLSKPVFAINLKTLEVLHFRSQTEASRELGVSNSHISTVIKGKRNQVGGFWFKKDNGNGIEIDNDKLKSIADSIRFRQGIFALNLITSEVSRFRSQREAGRVLGVSHGNVNNVIRGKLKQTHGFWFVNDDDKATDAIKRKLHTLQS